MLSLLVAGNIFRFPEKFCCSAETGLLRVDTPCYITLTGWLQPYKSSKFFEFSNYQKISCLSNIGLKIGDLSNFMMMLFSFLATILYYHLFLWLTWSHDRVLQRAYLHVNLKIMSYIAFVLAAQVLFEKMKEMIHSLPDPRPTLKVSRACTFSVWGN